MVNHSWLAILGFIIIHWPNIFSYDNKVENAEELVQKLGAEGQSSMKVLSIFGNTGDGKSHTLNHAFFDGNEVFKTSASQLSCTVGVWASYDSSNQCIILDTEGLLGMSGNQNQRTRLLLKVLAISDVIIFRTRAERLHTDLFTFLGDASEAYLKHFSKELQAATQRFNMNVPLCTLGPAIIIFHETQHTDLLGVVDEQTLLTGLLLINIFVGLRHIYYPFMYPTVHLSFHPPSIHPSILSCIHPYFCPFSYSWFKIRKQKIL